MQLDQLIASIPAISCTGNLRVPITGIAYNSGHVKAGDLFVCLPGENCDGHDYIPEAMDKGAVALVTDRKLKQASLPWVMVENTRQSLALLAAAFYDHPSKKLKVVGITGTNGKTTTSYFLQSIYAAAGFKSALLGTTGLKFNAYHREMDMTTPESLQVQEILALLQEKGAQAVSMEVSSHALAQHRVDACHFHAAVFTNLSRDHLDFHGNMENYFNAKSRLFASVAPASPQFVVLNADDPIYPRLKARVTAPVLTYGFTEGAAITVAGKIREGDFLTQHFRLKTPTGSQNIHLKLPERFNVANALAAATVGIGEGFSLTAIKTGLEAVTRVPGRLEHLPLSRDFDIFVDFAHTPDALAKVLAALRKKTRRQLITVFGCPGERDKGKRPIMGRIANQYSDILILTSDNPAREDPRTILKEIRAGVRGECFSLLDREEAVKFALSKAGPGDIVLLAGKGHERYQLVGEKKIAFSDQQTAEKYMRGRQEDRNATSPPPDFAEVQRPLSETDGAVYDKSAPEQSGHHDPSPGIQP